MAVLRNRPFRCINLNGRLMDMGGRMIMAIINITPDSFYAGSRISSAEMLEEKVAVALKDGAEIIDIGGYSSRPGAGVVSEKDEIERVLWALEIIRKKFGDIPVSVDTFRSGVIREVISGFGSCIVNDITSGEADSGMLELVGKYNLPYIAMHMRGMPDTMQSLANYEDVTKEVISYFIGKMQLFKEYGVEQVILDPGFGFAKTTEHNFELLRNLGQFKIFDVPLLVGVSRKSMVCRTLGVTPADALNGTTAIHWEALRGGANILRVHDVKEAKEVITLFEAFAGAGEN